MVKGNRSKLPATGSLLVMYGTVSALLPQFYVTVALILSERAKADVDTWRQAFLVSKLLAMLAEALWSAAAVRLHRDPLICATALAVNLACTVGSIVLVLQGGVVYSTALTLHVIAGLAAIPVSQRANQYVLETAAPQVRFRIAGWLCTLLVATGVLLVPTILADPTVIVGIVTMPTVLVVVLLLRVPHNNLESTAAASAKSKFEDVRVSKGTAMYYVLFACVISVSGEALLDMAVEIKTRDALTAGDNTLMLANRIAVLLSMALALGSETSLFRSASVSRRNLIYSGLWLLCQLLRSTAYGGGLLDGASASSWVGLFVFIDKYTGAAQVVCSGPLGGSAVEQATLAILRNGETGSALIDQHATVPVAFLMTLSSLAARCVRPVAEMLVMQQDLWPVPLPVVTVSLAVTTFSFVYAMLA